MPDWRKCTGCKRVLPLEAYEPPEAETCYDCRHKPPRRPRSSASNAENVRRWREKTGNAYGKAYAKARADATKALIAKHPDDFAELMGKARADHGLGPAQ